MAYLTYHSNPDHPIKQESNSDYKKTQEDANSWRLLKSKVDGKSLNVVLARPSGGSQHSIGSCNCDPPTCGGTWVNPSLASINQALKIPDPEWIPCFAMQSYMWDVFTDHRIRLEENFTDLKFLFDKIDIGKRDNEGDVRKAIELMQTRRLMPRSHPGITPPPPIPFVDPTKPPIQQHSWPVPRFLVKEPPPINPYSYQATSTTYFTNSATRMSPSTYPVNHAQPYTKQHVANQPPSTSFYSYHQSSTNYSSFYTGPPIR